jgi:hypothetical protein
MERGRAIQMRFAWRQQETGWGELLCFVLVWTVGLAAIWLDYARGQKSAAANKVAVSRGRPPATANLD